MFQQVSSTTARITLLLVSALIVLAVWGASLDTRVFAPYLIGEIPNQSDTENADSGTLNLHAYIACETYEGSGVNNPVWSASGLPTGISLNTSTGRITGTPTVTGIYSVTATCTNDTSSVNDSFSWEIVASSGETVTGLFFANDGSDSNDCTSHVLRCKTIAKLNALSPTAGTDVWFYTGHSFTDTGLTIPHAGTSGDHVIYGTYYVSSGVEKRGAGGGANASLKPASSITNLINLSGGEDYIDFENLILDGTNAPTAPGADSPALVARWVTSQDNTNITFTDVVFTKARGFNCIEIQNGDFWEFDNATMSYCGTNDDSTFGVYGDAINADYQSDYLYVHNSTCTYAGHNCIKPQGNYYVIRFNTFDGYWGDVGSFASTSGYRTGEFAAIDFGAAPNGQGLVEHNVFKRTRAPESGSSFSPYVKFLTSGTIFRFNDFDNLGTDLPDIGIQNATCCTNSTLSRYQRIYNNEWADLFDELVRTRTSNTTTADVSDNVWKNNVIDDPTNTNIIGDYDIQVAKRVDSGDEWDGNTWVDNCFAGATVQFKSTAATYSLASAESSFPSRFSGNNTSCSASADVGTVLTTTTDSGTGTSFTVADSRYFFDGEGIITGDVLDVNGDTVTVTSINHSTGVITVSGSFTWASGENVSLSCDVTPDHGLVAACGTAGDPD